MPIGPFALLDEIGLDVARHVAQTLQSAFGDRMRTAPLLEELDSNNDLLGKKAGAGFYQYKDGRRAQGNPAMHKLLQTSSTVRTSSPAARDVRDRALLSMANEAAYALADGVVESPAELDLAMIMGTGFPPFRGGLLRWIDSVGVGATVERLRHLAETHGERFTPAPLLVDMAGGDRRFYADV